MVTHRHIQVILAHTHPQLRLNKTASFSTIQKIYNAFKTAPQAWEKFKTLLGVTSNKISELHEGLQNILKYAKLQLRKISAKLLSEIPILSDLLGITVDTKDLEAWVDTKVFSKMSFKGTSFLDIGPLDMPAKVLDDLLQKSIVLRTLSKPAKIYLFLMMFNPSWDWDYSEFISGVLGELSFSDLAAMGKQEGLKNLLSYLFPHIPFAGEIALKVIQFALIAAAAISKTQDKVKNLSPAQRVQFFLNRWSELEPKYKLNPQT